MLKRIDNWLWPESDTECRKVAFDFASLETAIALCQHQRVAVQAGGNVGVWPAYLAEFFQAVYTAEPDADNFACLSANVTAPNVYKFQCGFGCDQAPLSLQPVAGNCGAGWLQDRGNIPVINIDDLRIVNVDLICLDIEGMELQALKGARQALEDCAPVILLEQKGHGRRYGYEDIELTSFLEELGYSVKARIARDVIYTKDDPNA